MSITVKDQNADLSALLKMAKDGNEVIITSDNVPVAKLVPLALPTGERKPGSMPELSAIPPEFFFDPLPEEELSAWE